MFWILLGVKLLRKTNKLGDTHWMTRHVIFWKNLKVKVALQNTCTCCRYLLVHTTFLCLNVFFLEILKIFFSMLPINFTWTKLTRFLQFMCFIYPHIKCMSFWVSLEYFRKRRNRLRRSTRSTTYLRSTRTATNILYTTVPMYPLHHTLP